MPNLITALEARAIMTKAVLDSVMPSLQAFDNAVRTAAAQQQTFLIVNKGGQILLDWGTQQGFTVEDIDVAGVTKWKVSWA